MWRKLPFSDSESCSCAIFKQIFFAGVTIILQHRIIIFIRHNNFQLQIRRMVKTFYDWSSEMLFKFELNFPSGNTIYSTGFVNTRLHFSLNEDMKLQVFYQNQFNSALELNQRDLFGANFGKTIHTKEYLYKFTVGSFLENETYSDLSNKQVYRGNAATSITAEVSDVDINLTVYYQPDIFVPEDYRLLGELALQFPISEQLVFEVESALRFDSDPHLDLLPLDFSTIIGMVYSISN